MNSVIKTELKYLYIFGYAIDTLNIDKFRIADNYLKKIKASIKYCFRLKWSDTRKTV